MKKITLSKKTLLKAWLRWFFFHTGAGWNWEKMMSSPFALMMSPVLKELYRDRPEMYAKRLNHHYTEFFNTEPQSGTIIHGITVALEEQIARGDEIDPSLVDSVKVGMMGPLAGIGDSMVPSLLNSLLLGIGISMALSGSIFGPIFFFFSYTGIVTFLSWYLFYKGYKTGLTAFVGMTEGGKMQSMIDGLNILGLTMIGALSAAYVSLNTSLVFEFSGVEINIQETLDSILPGILPLSFVFLVYHLMAKKNFSTVKVLGVVFLIGFALSLVGVI